MKWRDYSWIIRNFEPSVNKEGRISFVPKNKNPNNNKKLKLIMDRYGMHDMLPLDFANMVNRVTHIHSAEDIVNRSLASKFKTMSVWEVMRLTDEKKVRYLDAIIPDAGSASEDAIRSILNAYKENIQACLYSFRIPDEFTRSEQKNLEKFCKKLYLLPELKEKIENWDSVVLAERLELMNKVSKVFSDVYGIEFVEFRTFSDSQYDKARVEKKLKKPLFTPATQKTDEAIYIYEERLKNSDNYFPITITFHQDTNVYEDVCDLSKFPYFEKMMDEKFQALELETDLNILSPRQRHAYLMQFELERKIYGDLGVEKTKNSYDEAYRETVAKTLNNARTIAYYAK